MFCPKLVVAYLLRNFGSCEIMRAPCREEQKLIDKFTSILREASYSNLIVQSDEETTIEDDAEDPLWSADDEECDGTSGVSQGTFIFGEREVAKEKVDDAIAYYRSSSKGTRSLATMNKRYRFISSEYHMRKLRQLERDRDVRADRLIQLRTLADKLKCEVMSKLTSGITLHDSDIRRVALQINREYGLVRDFKASHSWIQNFKRSCGIVSRRITTFTSRKAFNNKDLIAEKAQNFILEAKKEMEDWPLDSICNADQSAFLKEPHTARSLAVRGTKKVERVVQSVSATTHSFTIMPLLFADGHLGKALFVVMQEPNGEFPSKGYFKAANLVVRAGKTHIMGKQDMLDWVKLCIASPESPQSTLLIVDSWTPFKDHESIQLAMPPEKSVKVLNIPPGTTALIQPLDVFFFLPFKSMYKRFTSHVVAHDIDFSVHTRDSILRLLSLVYFQFCSPRFRNFLAYSWYVTGYCDGNPGEFETPVQYCFPSELVGQCDYTGCREFYFIRCAHCQKLFCFDHFVKEYHMCS